MKSERFFLSGSLRVFFFLLPSQGFLKIFTWFKVPRFEGVVPVENIKPFEDIFFFSKPGFYK